MQPWQSDPLAVEDSFAYRVHRTARLLRKHFSALARQNGIDLTPEMWFILNRLRRADGRPQNELGDALFSDRPNLTRMFGRLEARGWIARRPDPKDGRKVLIWLTSEGQATHDRFAAIAAEARGRLFGAFDPAALAAAIDALSQFEAALLADM
jgi:DNA-binding MarR family transcriptional regulator